MKLNELIKSLLKERNMKQIETLEVLEVNSRQALYLKTKNNSYTLLELIRLLKMVNCDLVIKNHSTGKVIQVLSEDDIG